MSASAAERNAARDLKIVNETNVKLKQYSELGYNIPGATSVELKPYMLRPYIELISVDTNVEGGDIRPINGGKYELTAQALKRFRIAGNITFSEPKTTEIRKNFIEVEVTGKRFKLNGMADFHPDKKSLGLDDYEAYQRKEAIKRVSVDDSPHKNKPADEKNAIVEGMVGEAVASRKAFLRECAVTGAQNRVILKLLGLKAAYSMEELKKPFVIVSIVPDTNNEDLDPEVKRALTIRALELTEMMFPTARGISSEPTKPESPVVEKEAGSVLAVGCDNSVRPDDEFSEYPRDVQEQILSRALKQKNLSHLPFKGLNEKDLLSLYKQTACA